VLQARFSGGCANWEGGINGYNESRLNQSTRLVCGSPRRGGVGWAVRCFVWIPYVNLNYLFSFVCPSSCSDNPRYSHVVCYTMRQLAATRIIRAEKHIVRFRRSRNSGVHLRGHMASYVAMHAEFQVCYETVSNLTRKLPTRSGWVAYKGDIEYDVAVACGAEEARRGEHRSPEAYSWR
jgi:hypothetical protein